MDPDAALTEIRELVALQIDGLLSHQGADRLADLFVGLDEWLTEGGILPARWIKARRFV